ncbi:MAG TPA: ribosome maturation factor RimM [Rubricoccaceae bacterium]|jgi:16S rRNA processing protein RimM
MDPNDSAVDPDRLLLMGRLGRPHGIRGDIKLTPETDDPTRFESLRRLYLGRTPANATERSVTNVRFQYPKGRIVVLVKLDGVDTPEAAEALRNANVYADEEDLPALAEGEAFLHDLVGLAVWTVDEADEPTERIGTVYDLFDGAQLLFGIARENQPNVFLPDVEEFVVAVDLAGRRLLVRPPEGLFDDTADEVQGDEDGADA